MSRSLADALKWTRAGTALLDDAIARLADGDLREPTDLPGWTRAHLVAHIAGNARALGNLVRWAATGEETPMYASAEQRAAEIENGSARPARELLLAFGRSASDLSDAMTALTPAQWEHEVITAQRRTVLASEVPWLRAREVYVHAVDLGAGIGFADLPEDFLAALITDIRTKREDVPDVVGPLAETAAWLTGRPHSLSHAPDLGPWL